MIDTILRALSDEGGHLLVSTGSGAVDGAAVERVQSAIADSSGLKLIALPAGDVDQWLATINRLIADLPISRALAGDASFMRETTVVLVPVADSAQIAALQMLARAARALPGAGLRLLVFALAPEVLHPSAAALGPDVVHIELNPDDTSLDATDGPDRPMDWTVDRPLPQRLENPTEGLRDGDVPAPRPPERTRLRMGPGSAVAIALSLLAAGSTLWYSRDEPKPPAPPTELAALATSTSAAPGPTATPPPVIDVPTPPPPTPPPPAALAPPSPPPAAALTSAAPPANAPLPAVTNPPAAGALSSPPPVAAAPQAAPASVPSAPSAPSVAPAEPAPQAPRAGAATGGSDAFLSLVCSSPSVPPPVLKPVNPSKPGDMVYLSTSVRQAVCVTDGAGKTTRAIVETVDGRSFFGPPPWVIQVAAPDATQVFFQGSRIRVPRWVDGRIGLEAR